MAKQPPNGPGRPRPLKPSETAGLVQFLTKRRISQWDAIILGDGSGSNWERAAGWASVVIERDKLTRRIFTGSLDFGTVNFAEIMAFLQPLTWLASRAADRRQGSALLNVFRVHIFTDSEYCQTTGNRGGANLVKNAGLWHAVHAAGRAGLILRWHWIKRNTTGWHTLVDALSKRANKLAGAHNHLQQHVQQKV